jgi:hypothetical protein
MLAIGVSDSDLVLAMPTGMAVSPACWWRLRMPDSE